MTHADYRELRARYDELRQWQRQAARYREIWGDRGTLETRHKHQMRLAEAERELPRLEMRLVDSWGD